MWRDNNVRELIAVTVLHTSFLNIIVVTFKVLPLRSYALMPAPSFPLQNNYGAGFVERPSELLSYYSGIINIIKMLSFQCFLFLREEKNITGS
jgi:hypothetical protein